MASTRRGGVRGRPDCERARVCEREPWSDRGAKSSGDERCRGRRHQRWGRPARSKTSALSVQAVQESSVQGASASANAIASTSARLMASAAESKAATSRGSMTMTNDGSRSGTLGTVTPLHTIAHHHPTVAHTCPLIAIVRPTLSTCLACLLRHTPIHVGAGWSCCLH